MTKPTNGLYPLPAPMRKEALNDVLTNKTEYAIKWDRILAHIAAKRLSKASQFVGGIDKIEVAESKTTPLLEVQFTSSEKNSSCRKNCPATRL